MSSRDGAVTRMVGGPEEELAECASVLDCDGGPVSARGRKKNSEI